MKVFQGLSPSKFALPKLHSWVHHAVPSIRLFGALDGYSTETYESFHKDCVKNPYKRTNHKAVEGQMLNVVSKLIVTFYIHTAV